MSSDSVFEQRQAVEHILFEEFLLQLPSYDAFHVTLMDMWITA